ncbi:MAG: CRISPR-associated protein Cas4 [Desulfurococcales archaeon]|nr:CRISPR-associated protein Cas4 [Desulfurococcales archaeon]
MRASSYYDRGVLTAVDVKDYVYCPVIPWLKAVHGVAEAPTPSMEAGVVDVEYKEKVAEELSLPEPRRFEVKLVDRGLGVSGVVDVVAGPKGDMVVVEVKAGVRRPQRHHLAQLKVYALLASRLLGKVRRAALYTPGGVVWLRVDYRLLEEARLLVEEARKAVYSEAPPQARQPEAKCRYCFYSQRCPVRGI